MKVRSFLVVCIMSVVFSCVSAGADAGSLGEGNISCSPEEVLLTESRGYEDTGNSAEILFDYGDRVGSSDDVSPSFDDEFEKCVREELSIGSSEPISSEMCSRVDELVVKKSVRCLDGLDNFKNLKKLTLKGCKLKKSLSVKNYKVLRNVKWLDIRQCSLGAKLNLSGMSKLQILQADNCDGIDIINLDGCKSLKQIYLRNSMGIEGFKNAPSSVEVLDIAFCEVYDSSWVVSFPKLKYLWINASYIESISNFSRLEYLDCSDSYADSITISNCPNLKSIIASECFSNKISLRNLKSCNSVLCTEGIFKSFTVSNCLSMKLIDCRDNKISNLIISNSRNVDVLRCSGNRLRRLDVSMLPKLADLDCSDNYMSDISKVSGRSISMKNESSRFFFSPQRTLRKNTVLCKNSSLSLRVGKGSSRISLLGIPAGSVTKYKSSNNSICTVDREGNVKPIKKGKAVITIFNDGGYRCTSKTIEVPVKVSNKNKLTKVKNIKISKSGNVKWSKVKASTGYIIRYSYNKHFSSYVSEKSSCTNIKLNDVSGGRKVYIKIRPYVVFDGFTDYGAWSKVVSS